MYTEADAKEKCCPMSMAALGLGNQSAFCNGSICMAWRWVDVSWSCDKPTKESTGYCGLAGKP